MFFLKIIDDQDQELELIERRLPLADPEAAPVAHLGGRPGGHHRRGAARLRQRRAVPGAEGACRSTGKPGDRRRVVRDVFEDAYNYMKSGQLMRQVINKINEIDFNNLAERQHFGDIYEQILNDLQSAGNAGEYYTPRAVTAVHGRPHRPAARRDPARPGLRHRRLSHLRHSSTCASSYVKNAEARARRCRAACARVEKKQLPHMLCVTNMLLHGIEDPSFVRHDNTLARPYISYDARRPRGHRRSPTRRSAARRKTASRATSRRTSAPARPPTCSSCSDHAPAQARRPRRRGAARRHAVRRGRQDAAQGAPAGGVQPPHHRPPAQRRVQALRLIGTNLLFFTKGEPTKDIWFYEHRVPDGQKAYSMTKPIRVEHLQGCIDWWGGAERKGREETPQAPGRSRPRR